MKVRHYFSRETNRAGAINFASSLDRTHQEFKDECDINSIMARFHATGVLPSPWKSPPQAIWGDLATVPDYFEAQQLLLKAKSAFASLSSKVRERFANDPANLLAFVQDDANMDEAISLGLVPKPPPPAAPPPSPPKG